MPRWAFPETTLRSPGFGPPIRMPVDPPIVIPGPALPSFAPAAVSPMKFPRMTTSWLAPPSIRTPVPPMFTSDRPSTSDPDRSFTNPSMALNAPAPSIWMRILASSPSASVFSPAPGWV